MGNANKNAKKRQGQPAPQVETVPVPMPDSPQRFFKAIEIALQAASRRREPE